MPAGDMPYPVLPLFSPWKIGYLLTPSGVLARDNDYLLKRNATLTDEVELLLEEISDLKEELQDLHEDYEELSLDNADLEEASANSVEKYRMMLNDCETLLRTHGFRINPVLTLYGNLVMAFDSMANKCKVAG